MFDRLVARVLARPVDALVRNAIAEHLTRDRHGIEPEDLLYRYAVHGDRGRLRIDPTAKVNNALFNLSGGQVTVGPYAFFGHNVSVLTGTHDERRFGAERQRAIVRAGRDVVIEEGVWLASHVIVLGPCTIGRHAVAAAGALVLEDVPPYALVAGSPAKVLRTIEHDGDAG